MNSDPQSFWEKWVQIYRIILYRNWVYEQFYNREELEEIGFSSIGSNVLISRKASIFAPELVSIGSNVRIDDFCILSGIVTLGNYIHISAYTALYGSDIGIIVEDYSTISTRCTIFVASDDYSGEYLGNSAVPDFCRNIIKKQVVIKRFSTLGCGSVLFWEQNWKRVLVLV